jgi:hypothetical protein
MSESPRLEPSIGAILAPQLRADGFAGSGRTYRRIANSWIQVVNVQGSRQGGSFAINLALHPVGLPDVIGQPINPKSVSQDACELRRRLAEVEQDQWWVCYGDRESMNEAVQSATLVYQEVGRPLLNRLARPDSDLSILTASRFASGKYDLGGFGATAGRMALLFARLRSQQGRYEEAKAFVQYGLSVAGSADLLIRDLRAVQVTNAA